MNVDYPQATCTTCGEVATDIEIADSETLFYGDDTIFVLLVIVWCSRCQQHTVYFDAD